MPRKIESIGKYRVTGEIGRGGMGAVYTAVHPTLGTTVIIKKLTLRGNAGARERFRREAQIMMNLRHDAIVDVYDHFREGAYYYIVQEYVEGVSLDALIKERGAIPESIALLILRVVSRALAYAHDQNVIHRDIKPANILVSRTGEVKLVDFGIASSRSDDSEEDALTREGMTLGTPSYMAPEQFTDSRGTDKRADIYSLGVVLYEMVTGERPFPASFSPDAITRIQHGRYTRPHRLNRGLSFFTNRLIRRMMKKKRERRLSDLTGVVRSIDRYLRMPLTVDRRELIVGFLEKQEGRELPRCQRMVVPAFVMLFFVLIVVGTHLGAQRGYHRELFSPEKYGTVEVLLRIPAEVSEIEGVLYGPEAAGPPEAALPALRFSPVAEKHTEEYRVYRSLGETIPAGDYRLHIAAGAYLGRESFSLRSVRETTGSTLVIPGRRENRQTVVIEFLSVPELPLSLEYVFTDQSTGRLIEEGVEIFFLQGGAWSRISFFTARAMRSGRTYTFRFEHPLYEPKVMELPVAPHQSQIRLSVSLRPLN